MSNPNPGDFGMSGSNTGISNSGTPKGAPSDCGYTHRTAYEGPGKPSTFSWDEAEYQDSQGRWHREVTNEHANDGNRW